MNVDDGTCFVIISIYNNNCCQFRITKLLLLCTSVARALSANTEVYYTAKSTCTITCPILINVTNMCVHA